MSSATIAGTPTTGTSSSTSAHTVTLPSGIVSGERLVIAFVHYGSFIDTSLAGWSKEQTVSGSGEELTVFSTIASGSESTVDITTDSATTSVHAAMRVVDAVLAAFSGGVTGTGTSPDPAAPIPSLSTIDDVLQITFAAWSGAATLSSYPSGYTQGQATQVGGSGGNEVGVAIASKSVVAGTENPPAYALSSSSSWSTWTLAFEYAETIVGDIDIDLGTLVATLTLNEVQISVLQVNLGVLEATAELPELEVVTSINLSPLAAIATLPEAYLEIDPINLGTLEATATLQEPNVFIATNINISSLSVVATLPAVSLTQQINLGVLQATFSMPCFNSFKPFKNRLKMVDTSGSFWNVCHVFPESLTEGDQWAVSLVGNDGQIILHDTNGYTWGMSTPLSDYQIESEGDYLHFRFINGKVRLIASVIQ